MGLKVPEEFVEQFQEAHPNEKNVGEPPIAKMKRPRTNEILRTIYSRCQAVPPKISSMNIAALISGILKGEGLEWSEKSKDLPKIIKDEQPGTLTLKGMDILGKFDKDFTLQFEKEVEGKKSFCEMRFTYDPDTYGDRVGVRDRQEDQLRVPKPPPSQTPS